MTDIQILTIAIAIIIPISSLIYSNNRIADVRDSCKLEHQRQIDIANKPILLARLLRVISGRIGYERSRNLERASSVQTIWGGCGATPEPHRG
jgi:hypothetical protein